MSVRVLLSGVPGGGKTTIGEELARRYGFLHVDMEAERFKLASLALEDVQGFLGGVCHPGRNIALSWGFGPFACADAVRAIVDEEFVPFWFDGDRAWFYSSFMRRERDSGKPLRAIRAMEVDYYGQMVGIIQTGIRDALPWVEINPFHPDGSRRLDVAEEIVERAAGLEYGS